MQCQGCAAPETRHSQYNPVAESQHQHFQTHNAKTISAACATYRQQKPHKQHFRPADVDLFMFSAGGFRDFIWILQMELFMLTGSYFLLLVGV